LNPWVSATGSGADAGDPEDGRALPPPRRGGGLQRMSTEKLERLLADLDEAADDGEFLNRFF
jgi:hypothetical protein